MDISKIDKNFALPGAVQKEDIVWLDAAQDPFVIYGADKADDHPEYGNTVCCEDFRRRETEYLKEVIAKSQAEYEAEGVKKRLVICHFPFTEKFSPPVDIEEDTYTEWATLLRENIQPQLMLGGHIHKDPPKDNRERNSKNITETKGKKPKKISSLFVFCCRRK